jgi:hypothetical protein
MRSFAWIEDQGQVERKDYLILRRKSGRPPIVPIMNDQAHRLLEEKFCAPWY